MVQSIFKNKVVKNASWLIAGKMIQMVLNFFIGILTARYLGPSNYGLINYAASYSAFFYPICTLGINSIIVKELVDNPNQEGQVLGTSLLLRGISSFLSALGIIAISLVVDSSEPTTKLVVTLYTLSLILQIFDLFNYWFQSRLQSKITAFVTSISYTITSIYKVYLLVTDKSVIYFALSMSVDYLCLAVLSYYFYKREGGRKLRFCKQYAKEILSKSYHFILPSLMVAIYGQTDKIMLKHLISESEIGYYSLAVSLCSVWCFILSAIIDSLNPSIMKAHRESKEKFNKYNRTLYFLIFYISIFVSILFTVFGEYIILILYGQSYLPAVAPLRIVTWYTAFSYLGVARNSWIVCEQKQKYLKYIYVIAAISNIFLNLLFIPRFGAVGAAIASLIAQALTSIIVPLFIKEMKENSILMIEAILFKDIK